MYPVSAAFLEAIQSRSVETRWFGNIHTKIGMLYDFDAASIVEGSGKVTRQICAGSDIEIGTTCSSQLDVSLRMANLDRYALFDSEIKLFFQLLTRTGWETVPVGVFYVTEPPTRTLDVITLHAYDAMQKFDKPFGLHLQGSPYYLLSYACNACGVELGMTQNEIANLTNGNIDAYTYDDVQIYTFRDFVGFIASYLCCFAYIGVDGRLYLKQYGMDPVRTISESWRFAYKPQDYEAFYSALEAFFAVTEEYETVTLGGSGLTYELDTNPLIQFNSDEVRKAILTNILVRLAEAVYTPFDASVPCDPSLMVGDVLNFVGNHAVDGKRSAITKQVIWINRRMDLQCVGSDPTLSEIKTDREKRLASVAKEKNQAGMYYYDYANAEDITIVDGQTARVILFDYATKKETHIDLHAEIKCMVSTSESYNEETDTYTEEDGVLTVIYKSGGDVITEYYPVDTFFDGLHLLHLAYSWLASGNLVSSFEIMIRCTGCFVVISQGSARAYIAGVGIEGENIWDGSIRLEDEFSRIAFNTIRKPFESAAEHSLIAPITPGPNQNIIRRNFYSSLIKPIEVSAGATRLHRFSVLYNAQEMQTVNAHVTGNTWVVVDTAQIGLVTTPDCAAESIIQITSKNSGTDVAYVVSFDSGSEWWTFKDNNWAAPDYTQDLYGMFETTLRAITPAQWAEKLTGTVMVRALLIESATLTDIQIFTEVSNNA